MNLIDLGNDNGTLLYMSTYIEYIQLKWPDYPDDYSGIEVYFTDLSPEQQRDILDAAVRCEKEAVRWCVDYKNRITDYIRHGISEDYDFISFESIKL